MLQVVVLGSQSCFLKSGYRKSVCLSNQHVRASAVLPAQVVTAVAAEQPIGTERPTTTDTLVQRMSVGESYCSACPWQSAAQHRNMEGPEGEQFIHGRSMSREVTFDESTRHFQASILILVYMDSSWNRLPHPTLPALS